MMENKPLYKQTPWSLQKYILTYWYFWVSLLFIFLVSISFLYKLSSNNYFTHEMIEQNTSNITILGIRSDIFTTVLVTNPYDNNKPYEIDLGYFCKAKGELQNKKTIMITTLYRRNYNKTFFVDFPQAHSVICRNSK